MSNKRRKQSLDSCNPLPQNGGGSAVLVLSVGMFDPCRIGYGDPLFDTALRLIASLAWFYKCQPGTLCIALATLVVVAGLATCVENKGSK